MGWSPTWKHALLAVVGLLSISRGETLFSAMKGGYIDPKNAQKCAAAADKACKSGAQGQRVLRWLISACLQSYRAYIVKERGKKGTVPKHRGRELPPADASDDDILHRLEEIGRASFDEWKRLAFKLYNIGTMSLWALKCLLAIIAQYGLPSWIGPQLGAWLAMFAKAAAGVVGCLTPPWWVVGAFAAAVAVGLALWGGVRLWRWWRSR